jgi:hypothetical protein
MMGRHRLVFVPLAGARVAPRHVRVMADKKLVKNSPSIDLDGELGRDSLSWPHRDGLKWLHRDDGCVLL